MGSRRAGDGCSALRADWSPENSSIGIHTSRRGCSGRGTSHTDHKAGGRCTSRRSLLMSRRATKSAGRISPAFLVVAGFNVANLTRLISACNGKNNYRLTTHIPGRGLTSVGSSSESAPLSMPNLRKFVAKALSSLSLSQMMLPSSESRSEG